ncbi:hypothetical protein O1D97_04010 [Marinomonas sp. 15G1-11]|uniref:Anti sigma-E protein RseA N-terminal domain-containing protein n=1 Tax=Marinomonas phaeophyticola TaxID=3004091 RepID=A0ABT4JS25_9GAMM|nr:hypothetical protein [Marinomonas sp. 15G1-11]MCZ2720827.1 hypothetical protein [Marinomonas sp. 15G1-11]
MNTSEETLQNERIALSLSDLVDDRLSTEDLDFLLELDAKDLDAKLNAYAITKQVMGNATEARLNMAEFDLLHRVRVGIEDIVPDAVDTVTDETFEGNVTHRDTNVVNLMQQKILADAKLDNDNASEKKGNLISMKSFALAASVAFVALLGGQLFLSQDAGFSSANLDTLAVASVDQTDDILASPQDIKALSLDVHNERLQSYLRQHTEQATMATGQGMIPMARVVSFSLEDEQ